MLAATSLAHAAQLSGDAKAAIPKDVQQIIVVDYKQMQTSPAAMQLKDRVLPPELKHLETALKTSGLKVDQDAEVLAFAAFRDKAGTGTRILGVAQGQFQTADIMAKFAKDKTKAVAYRQNSIYPMGSAGMSVVFLNQTTMVFGDRDAVKSALDARGRRTPSSSGSKTPHSCRPSPSDKCCSGDRRPRRSEVGARCARWPAAEFPAEQ
jgi:hypothetical protein